MHPPAPKRSSSVELAMDDFNNVSSARLRGKPKLFAWTAKVSLFSGCFLD
jgi:hypothetical protein